MPRVRRRRELAPFTGQLAHTAVDPTALQLVCTCVTFCGGLGVQDRQGTELTSPVLHLRLLGVELGCVPEDQHEQGFRALRTRYL